MVNFAATTLLTILATGAMAQPRHDRRHVHHRRQYGYNQPSESAPYGLPNSTYTAPAGTGVSSQTQTSTTTVVSVVTVVPVPAEPTAPQGPVSPSVSGAAGTSNTGAGSSPTGPAVPSNSAPGAPGAPSAPGQCGQTVTVTAAETVYVTVPYGGESSPSSSSAAVPSSAPATSAQATSETVPAPAPTSETPTLPAYTAPAPESSSSAKFEGAGFVAKPVVPTSSTSEPAPAQSSASSGSGSAPGVSGGKRGIVYNDVKSANTLASGCSWAWDWSMGGEDLDTSIEFVPILQNEEALPTFSSEMEKAIGKGAKAVMIFNEPDMLKGNGGSYIEASNAASLYKQYAQPFQGKVLLGSPSVTSYNTTTSAMGPGGLSGMMWMRSFAQSCSDCHFDFINAHWYGGAGQTAQQQIDAFNQYVKDVVSDVDRIFPGKNLPIWFSEFAAAPGPEVDPALNAAFIEGVIGTLEGNSRIERYSYFKADFLANTVAAAKYLAGSS